MSGEGNAQSNFWFMVGCKLNATAGK